MHDEPDTAAGRLDLAGAALASIGLAGLTWGLTAASRRAASTPAAALAAGPASRCWRCSCWERKAGARAMLPLALFASRAFVGLNLLTFLLYGALGVLLVAVPFVLIEAAAIRRPRPARRCCHCRP